MISGANGKPIPHALLMLLAPANSRHPPTPQLWLETFLSALLRAINYADDSSYRLAGFRKLDPITTPEAERRFLEVAEQLFEQGWQLGSDPEIQVATITTNHLTNGIIKYFKDSGRLDVARRFFERVIAKAEKNGQPESMANIGEVRALVARCCIGMSKSILLIPAVRGRSTVQDPHQVLAL